MEPHRGHSQARQPGLLLQREHVENVPPLKKGPWTAEEDALLLAYVSQHGDGNWNSVQKYSGVARCGKSCRLRWINHLRPNLKKCSLTTHEESLIIEQHALLGSQISAMLHGRTDNEVENFWRLLRAGQPLYPPDIIPATRARSQHRDSEHSAYEGDVSLNFSGDVPVDSSTLASSLKSMTTSTRTSAKGKTCPAEVSPNASQTYFNINGRRSKSSTNVDEGGFSLTSGTHITGGTNILNRNTYENAVSEVRCPMQVLLNVMPHNVYGGPIYHLSSTNKPEREVRHLYDHNLERSGFAYQGFPYDPQPPDQELSVHGLSSGGVSFGVDLGSKQIRATALGNFCTPRHGIAGPLSFQNAASVASTDPLSLRGGRLLTLFGDDLKTTSENSSSSQDPLFAFHVAYGKDNSDLEFNEQVLPLLNQKTDDQSTGPCADEELVRNADYDFKIRLHEVLILFVIWICMCGAFAWVKFAVISGSIEG